MLALSHRFCSLANIEYWPSEEASGIFVEPDNFIVPQITVDSYNDRSPQSYEAAKKKLNHNASERDRRKKINHLYSSLRSLLPASDHVKKLSIPATVSFASNYIPELELQVEGLVRKRDELFSIINSRQQMNLQLAKQKDDNNDVKFTIPTSIYSFSSNQLNDTEFAVQISSHKGNKNSLSDALHNLEELGLSLLSASSFESVAGRVFHNLQFKVERSDGVKCRTIGEKLMSTYHNKKMLSYASILQEKLYM